MKKLAIVAILVLTFTAGALADTRTAVLAALQAQTDAWNRGDVSGWLDAFVQTPQATYTAGGKLLNGFAAIREGYQPYVGHPQSMGTLQIQGVDFYDMGGRHALTVVSFRLEQRGRAVEGVMTLAWVKIDRFWKILHDHFSARNVAARAAPTRESGDIVIQDEVPGTGTVASPGMRLTVQYTGWLLSGQKFDSSLDRGQPFTFVLGQGQVIPGWDQGLVGMRVGGKRRLTIPPNLAYGARGQGPVPPNATLVFEIELLSAQRP